MILSAWLVGKPLLGFAALHLVAAVFWLLLKTEGRVYGEVMADG